MPSANLTLGNVSIDAGEFTNGKWGFKGETCLSGYCTGVYIDTGGAIAFGSAIRNYTRLTPSQLAHLRQLWAARERGEISAAAASELQGVTLAPAAVILNAEIGSRSDVVFALSIEGTAPPVQLLSPSGTVFDQHNLPANITYNEVVTLNVGSSLPANLATALGCRALTHYQVKCNQFLEGMPNRHPFLFSGLATPWAGWPAIVSTRVPTISVFYTVK